VVHLPELLAWRAELTALCIIAMILLAIAKLLTVEATLARTADLAQSKEGLRGKSLVRIF
jgi:hypothetical protein